MLGLGLLLPGGGTIVSSNAEVAELAEDRIRFSPGLGGRTEVWLRTDRRVGGRERAYRRRPGGGRRSGRR